VWRAHAIVVGDFESLGGATMYNESRGKSVSVSVEDYHCSAEVVLQMFRLRCLPR